MALLITCHVSAFRTAWTRKWPTRFGTSSTDSNAVTSFGDAVGIVPSNESSVRLRTLLITSSEPQEAFSSSLTKSSLDEVPGKLICSFTPSPLFLAILDQSVSSMDRQTWNFPRNVLFADAIPSLQCPKFSRQFLSLKYFGFGFGGDLLHKVWLHGKNGLWAEHTWHLVDDSLLDHEAWNIV